MIIVSQEACLVSREQQNLNHIVYVTYVFMQKVSK